MNKQIKREDDVFMLYTLLESRIEMLEDEIVKLKGEVIILKGLVKRAVNQEKI